jgi:hypothetical protein
LKHRVLLPFDDASKIDRCKLAYLIRRVPLQVATEDLHEGMPRFPPL